jgi:limonene 1,2-monooxygenase
MTRGLTDVHDVDRMVDQLNASGLMVIGTPDMLVEHLESFRRQTGGFGGFLGFGTEMADFAATKHSYELLIDRVAPRLNGSSARQQENFAHLARLGHNWKSEVRDAQRAVTDASRDRKRPA